MIRSPFYDWLRKHDAAVIVLSRAKTSADPSIFSEPPHNTR
jgi:hypothetical protein